MAENNAGVINALKQSNIEGAKVIKDELKDQFKPFTDQLMAPLNSIKAGISSLPGVGVTKKLFTAVSTPLKNAFKADQTANIDKQKEDNFMRRMANSEKSIFLDIRDTLVAQNKTLMEGLAGMKDKGLMGLGVMAGLIAAPFAFLTGFFGQLATEVKLLAKIVGKGGKKLLGIFDPMIDLFKSIGKFAFDKIKGPKILENLNLKVGEYFTKMGQGIGNAKIKVADLVVKLVDSVKTLFKTLGNKLGVAKVFGKIDDFLLPIKNFATSLSTKFTTIATKGDDVIKTVGGVGNKIATASKATGAFIKKFTILDTIVDTVKGFINPIKGAFNAIKTGSDALKPFMAGFKPVVTFAQTIGKVLGKIFFPITILMSAFDFVTGFMDGYDEGGVLGGLEGGITKLFKGLIGMPLDLLKSGIGYILGFFGFDNAKAALDKFSFSDLIEKLIGGIFDGLKGVFGFLGNLFDFSDLTIFKVFSKLIDIVFLPLNLAINFVKDIFGFGDPDKPFSFGEFITGLIGKAVKLITDFFDIDVSAITNFVKGFIPDSLLSFFGFGDDAEKSPTDQAKAIEQQIKEAQDRIARSEGGENVYMGFEGRGRDADAAMVAEMQKELELLKAQGGGGTTIINNNNDNRTSSQNVTLQSQQLQDANGIANS